MAVAAFLESTDFESAIKLAISYGSDSDTIAAMAGSIAEAYYKEIPLYIANFCKCKLDKHAACLCKEFFDFVNKQSQKTYEKQYQNIKAGAELALMFKVG